MSDQFGYRARPAFRMRGLLVGVNAQRFGSFECGCFSRKCLYGTDYCFPAFACSIKGGFPPAEDPNVGPTLPLFAFHASLLIPCSPRHDLSWIGATDGCFQRTEMRGRGRACFSPLPSLSNLASVGAREASIGSVPIPGSGRRYRLE